MIRFVKAHACGNDFLIVREEDAHGEEHGDLASWLCHRNRGIGADGVEFLASESKTRGKIHLYNADGSPAEISGNGTRCAAAWMAYEGALEAGDTITLVTDAGPRACRIVSRHAHCFEIASGIGVPEVQKGSVSLAGGLVMDGAIVSTGNPHFVVFVEGADFSVHGRDWESLGREICIHSHFPRQTNVEFVRLAGTPAGGKEIEIRIFERGVGPTSSSGTGTCAAAAAAIRLLGCPADLGVTAPGGRQTVHWEGGGAEMLLTGPAALICSGDAFR